MKRLWESGSLVYHIRILGRLALELSRDHGNCQFPICLVTNSLMQSWKDDKHSSRRVYTYVLQDVLGRASLDRNINTNVLFLERQLLTLNLQVFHPGVNSIISEIDPDSLAWSDTSLNSDEKLCITQSMVSWAFQSLVARYQCMYLNDNSYKLVQTLSEVERVVKSFSRRYYVRQDSGV